MIRSLAYPAWMLSWIVVAIVRHEIAWCTAAGALGLGVQTIAARGWRTASGRFAAANALTVVRLAIVVALPYWLAAISRAAFVALVASLLVLDGVDGRVARARREASDFGARLDMETDALTVMVLSFLL